MPKMEKDSDNEADTCRKYITPRIVNAGWDNEPHSFAEQQSFTDGRIIVVGDRVRRNKKKRADYLLRYSRDFPLAVVEAKAKYRLPSDGLQQAKEYAEILELKFAYSTNGNGIVEFDFIKGIERSINDFPSPEELWSRFCAWEHIDEPIQERLLVPSHYFLDKRLRYYQEIAINRVVQAILQGKKRMLLNLATGTGKTLVAFQICWKLWSSRWNRMGEHRRPKVLYLADRTVLIDDPKDKTFAPFGDARWKIENGEANKSREIYFSTYQAIAKDERRPGLYKEYSRDFFDLIIVDECHRGSARDESNWREILEYFNSSFQIGMTATPLREDNRDTYLYFGNPIYTYSLRQGIEDGFLAPYRVHRVITDYDAAGWRPSKGQLDRYGHEIPDILYQPNDFERIISLRARTNAVAKHLSDFLMSTDRFAKTIVFCVDQEHADIMRHSLSNLNSDLVQQYPDYVCRVTADEGDIGRGCLSKFQELDIKTPVILTTSKLLTTGIDAQTCKNIVLFRIINSMTEFKQIIGRGTRVREDYGKMFFSILDYTGSATRLFADPSFDGTAALITEEEIDEMGDRRGSQDIIQPEEKNFDADSIDSDGSKATFADENEELRPRKYYVDGGYVRIATHLVYELDAEGRQLRVVELMNYAAEKVRTLFGSQSELRDGWADLEQRAEIIASLQEKGIDFNHLAKEADQPEADPLDLICYIAFNAPPLTRRQRAERLKKNKKDFFDRYGPEAKRILEELLEKYSEHGTTQFEIPETLKVPPISEYGNIMEISGLFGGPERLRQAISDLQSLLYAV